MNPRYEGKPFLRLLECYILHVIGALSDVDRSALEGMEPKLRQTYKQAGTWHEIVGHQMGFSQGPPDAIQRNWRENQDRAVRAGQKLNPEDFARYLADFLISSRAADSSPSAN